MLEAGLLIVIFAVFLACCYVYHVEVDIAARKKYYANKNTHRNHVHLSIHMPKSLTGANPGDVWISSNGTFIYQGGWNLVGINQGHKVTTSSSGGGLSFTA